MKTILVPIARNPGRPKGEQIEVSVLRKLLSNGTASYDLIRVADSLDDSNRFGLWRSDNQFFYVEVIDRHMFHKNMKRLAIDDEVATLSFKEYSLYLPEWASLVNHAISRYSNQLSIATR